MPDHFAILDYQFSYNFAGAHVYALTDIPVSLTLRIGLVTPQVQLKTVNDRGLWVRNDPQIYFGSFVDYDELPYAYQTTHGFLIPRSIVEAPHYGYFYARTATGTCASVSPPLYIPKFW